MQRKQITVIAAVSQNKVIGKEGGIPWHIPEDLRWFKACTQSKKVVMGRKTMEDIHSRLGGPLPGRTNLVLTNSNTVPDGFIKVTLKQLITWSDIERFYVIGGEVVYRQFIPMADELILTHVLGEYEGDAHFPDYDPGEWEVSWADEVRTPQVGLIFAKYRRKDA